MNDETKLKAWITWPENYTQGWCHCVLILENGLVMFDHLCSNPGFAMGDLWTHRKERQEMIAKAGFELEIVDQLAEPYLPPGIMERNKARTWEKFADNHFYDYFKSKEAEPAGATLVMQDDDGKEFEVRVP